VQAELQTRKVEHHLLTATSQSVVDMVVDMAKVQVMADQVVVLNTRQVFLV
jgi:hypothetical protein